MLGAVSSLCWFYDDAESAGDGGGGGEAGRSEVDVVDFSAGGSDTGSTGGVFGRSDCGVEGSDAGGFRDEGSSSLRCCSKSAVSEGTVSGGGS